MKNCCHTFSIFKGFCCKAPRRGDATDVILKLNRLSENCKINDNCQAGIESEA